ncbi:serpentine type 7TM GPCR chemoreceptor srh domain-containing protein [Ditylenchus destructor]|nr:serpentine type 7TM GPCR chemoreceptor srh domain-containing protein [Ditylenchus destructor]
MHKTPKNASPCIKYNFLNICTSSYLHAILLALWQVVPLFPDAGGYSAGPIGLLPIDHITKWMYMLSLILVFNVSLALMVAFLRHFSLLKPSSRTAFLFESRLYLITFYSLSSLIIDVIIILLVDSMHVPTEDFKTILSRESRTSIRGLGILPASSHWSPFIWEVLKEQPTLIAYTTDSAQFRVSIILLVLSVLTQAVVIVLFNFKILGEIRATKPQVQASTHRLQVMIYRTFLISTLLFLFGFIIPGLVIPMAVLGWINSYYPSIAMYALIALQSPCILLNILIFVKPYRRGVVQLFHKMTCGMRQNRRISHDSLDTEKSEKEKNESK